MDNQESTTTNNDIHLYRVSARQHPKSRVLIAAMGKRESMISRRHCLDCLKDGKNNVNLLRTSSFVATTS